MKNLIRNLLGSLLAYALGVHSIRKKVLSEDQESATSDTTSKAPYIRDSKEREPTEGETELPKYQVYSKEHIEQLKKTFPQKRWDKSTSEAELAFSAGQQSVIDNIEKRLTSEGRKAHVLN